MHIRRDMVLIVCQFSLIFVCMCVFKLVNNTSKHSSIQVLASPLRLSFENLCCGYAFYFLEGPQKGEQAIEAIYRGGNLVEGGLRRQLSHFTNWRDSVDSVLI